MFLYLFVITKRYVTTFLYNIFWFDKTDRRAYPNSDLDTFHFCSVEKCECNEGYFGLSCEDCAIGYFRSQEDQLGVICEPCNCNGHAESCHPLTGECYSMIYTGPPLTPEECEKYDIPCHTGLDERLVEKTLPKMRLCPSSNLHIRALKFIEKQIF